ncbi:MAG: hypothetical protein LBT95_01650, partial [Treponema sp.]|nr:hypothetical protein [Treponema sp.]
MAAPYLDLVFDIPSPQVVTYRIDPKGEGGMGKRVMVPFGRREALGYIVAERESLPPGVEEAGIKAVRRVVDGEPVFDKEDWELAEWMAGYYLCGIGQALAAMIPSGRRGVSPPSLPDEGEMSPETLELSGEQARALEALTGPFPGYPGPLPAGEGQAGDPGGPEQGDPGGEKTGAPRSLPPPPMFYLSG